MNRTMIAVLAVGVVSLPLTAASEDAADYVGRDTCAACHADVTESFEKTSHASSLEVLEAAGSDGEAECLECHATGVDGTDYVDGAVTCEACHGPGGEHVATGDKAEINSDVGESDCLKCHTSDWSADFDFETYKAEGTHGD